MLFAEGSSSRRCKELVIRTLAHKPSLSAKKVHRAVQDQFQGRMSYQAVHKTLQSLFAANVLRKFQNEYYLNPEWVENLTSFVDTLKGEKKLPRAELSPSFNPTQKVKTKAIRFVPFYLGKVQRRKLPKGFTVVSQRKDRIFFQNEDRTYVWYTTGVCIQIIPESEKELGIVDFLWERRKAHQELLNLLAPSTKDLASLVFAINPNSKVKLSYVMSIHYVDSTDDKVLRLIADPGILGIHDNPKQVVEPAMLRFAQKKLISLAGTTMKSENTYELTFNPMTKVFASWSNVAFCCSDDEQKTFREQLIEIECELQHLWSYGYLLRNELRKHLRNKNTKKFKKLHALVLDAAHLWQEFGHLEAMDDTQTFRLKKALIKTSRIEKIFQELQTMHALCKKQIKL